MTEEKPPSAEALAFAEIQSALRKLGEAAIREAEKPAILDAMTGQVGPRDGHEVAQAIRELIK